MTFLILLYSDILIIAPGSKNTTPLIDDGVDDMTDVLSTDDDDNDGGHDRVTFTPATLTFDDGIPSLVYFIDHYIKHNSCS